jgi:hypothetical protein
MIGASATSFNQIVILVAPIFGAIAVAGIAGFVQLRAIAAKVDGRLDATLAEVKAGRTAIDSLQGIISQLTGVPAPALLTKQPTPTPLEIEHQNDLPVVTP